MEKSELLDKIRKLQEKADSAKSLGNQAEAEAFALKVQELMLKYQVQESELREATGGKMQMKGIILNWMDLTNRHESDWVKFLIHKIAVGNMCRAVGLTFDPQNGLYPTGQKHREGDIWLGGQPENLEMAQYMIDQMVVRARMAAKTAFKTYDGPEKRNTFIRGFLRGFALGLGEKLLESLKQHTQEATSSTGLMIIKNSQAVDLFTKSKFPNLSATGAHKLSGKSGNEMGRETGRQTSIHRGISSSGTAHTIKRLG